MLLRSSSTPVLGSLLSSQSHPESPAHCIEPASRHPHTASFSSHKQLSFHASAFSCNSSPISPSVSHKGSFRRAQSEGNLEELAYSSINGTGDDQLKDHYCCQAKKFSSVLQTIPSFSFHSSGGRYEDDEEEEEDEDEEEDANDIDDDIIESQQFREYNEVVASSAVKEEMDVLGIKGPHGFEDSKEMYLAKGLGIGAGIGCGGSDGRGGSGGGSCTLTKSGGDGRENQGVEEYYKRMVEENPNNSLFLRNYAQFLYQSKGEVERAEEFYSRAILADPGDGELLSQYAKIVWELYRDEERASSYFERAAQASPQDSHVQAAYASFLWEIEDDVKELNAQQARCEGAMASSIGV